MTKPTPGILRDQVYAHIRNALMMGKYVPGQKLVIRQLADAIGTSLTPVRETLRRLVAEGVLEGEAKRSVRVPRMTGEKIRELRDIRLAVEVLAVSRAAERIEPKEIQELRIVAGELMVAREQDDVAADVAKQGEFQFGVYRASRMPNLLRIIESLWLQTGPYLKLLFPNYIDSVRSRRAEWRNTLCDALERHDVDAARREIEIDLNETLEYLIALVDAADVIGPLDPLGEHGG